MGVLLGLAGDLAAPRLPRDMVAERGGKAGIGEIGPGLGDGLKAPDPAQIGQRDEERGAALQLPQAAVEIALRQVPRLPEERDKRVLRLILQRVREPVPLPPDQPGEIGRTARRPLDERAKSRAAGGACDPAPRPLVQD
jgi:hypothetical protein